MSAPTTIERVAARLDAAGIGLSQADVTFLASTLPALDAACASVRAGVGAAVATTDQMWQPRAAWVRVRRSL